MTSVESEILALLAKARSFVKETEFLFCNSFPVPAINEFRNVSYHLAEYIQSPKNTRALESALRHAKKAYLDANEAYAIALLDEIERTSKVYAGYSEVVAGLLPNYCEQKRAIIHLQKTLRTSPLDSEAQRFDRAKELEHVFPKVVGFLKDIETYNDPIQDQIRKQKAIARQWIIGILIAIVTSVIGYLISFFA